MKTKVGFYRMAKEAHHKLGNISRDKWDLVFINKEDNKNFYGFWVYGFGFINVRFPKKSTRKLTKKEIKKYNNSIWGINGIPIKKLNIDNG